ncbi:unnamed protein product, partial [Porites lobata]
MPYQPPPFFGTWENPVGNGMIYTRMVKSYRVKQKKQTEGVPGSEKIVTAKKPSQAGGDLFDTAVGTATDLFVHHALPWMGKRQNCHRSIQNHLQRGPKAAISPKFKVGDKVSISKYKRKVSRETRRWSETYFIDEAGFYELVFGSKLKTAKKIRDWVFTQVLPSIRKHGQYKLFDNPNNHMFKFENEFDLHTKVVEYIRRFYP